MGYFLGKKIPEYNPWWNEDTYQDDPEYIKWYNLGYEDGHTTGLFSSEKKELECLRQKVSSLENLLAANVRVIKQEILNEQKEIQGKENEDGNLELGHKQDDLS